MTRTGAPISDRGHASLLVLAIGALAVMAIMLAPARASAAEVPPLLWQTCENGQGAGKCEIPRSIVVAPSTGDVYVADQDNGRIDEFTAWGVFVKAWGWGVRDGASELQTCTTATGCRAGLVGSGAGEFDAAEGLALDSEGSLYAVDWGNERVQKFDPTAGPEENEAKFLLMFGGNVNRTAEEDGRPSEENVCPAAGHPTDICRGGTVGTGNGQFDGWVAGSFLAVGPGDEVYVGDRERIQEFDDQGVYSKSIALPGKVVQSLAIDSSGNLYASFCSGICNININNPTESEVRKLSPTGEMLGVRKAASPVALAVDSSGDLYVVDGGHYVGDGHEPSRPTTIREFNSTGAELLNFSPGGLIENPTGIAVSSACGIAGIDVYVANSIYASGFVAAFGPSPDPTVCPPPTIPPEVTYQYTLSAGVTDATVGALINPFFWPDATYDLEYGTGKCSEGGCTSKTFLPGLALGGGAADTPLATKAAFLTGLSPSTTYHYRFVAQSGGGGPVFGTGSAGEATFAGGGEASFTTSPLPLQRSVACPNQAFRIGPSASLPDCRAYEMVSPVDKQGADVEVLPSFDRGVPARLDQASSTGERLTYSSYRAFSNPQSAPWTSQYMAVRSGSGWTDENISPPQAGGDELENGDLDSNYKAFSEDLCNGWILKGTEPLLATEAIPGFANLYRRDNCSEGAFEAISKGTPSGVDHGVNNKPFIPAVEGFSADGSRTFFSAAGKLVPEASTEPQLYESNAGSLTLVCYLPSGAVYAGRCGLGTSINESYNHSNDVYSAVSADGSRVFWSDAAGRLYVRQNPGQPQSEVSGGRCTEASEKACTIAISAGQARFQDAAPDGSRVIFSSGTDLYEADLEEEIPELFVHSRLIAHGVQGVMGASEDVSRVYFASSEVLTQEQNGAHDKAVVGKPNLYLYQADEGTGVFRFIGTLSNRDTGTGYSSLADSPISHVSRISADGTHAVFMSTASLTGYDNTDQSSGEADAEVYLYDSPAGGLAGRLRCVSCDPSGARPLGALITSGEGLELQAAAQIPGWSYQLHPARALSADGSRLFFDSFDPLVLRDTDGTQDVYEWERGESQSECEAKGAERFLEGEGGCLSLISSGESTSSSTFIDADAAGSNVFFTTSSSLVPQDPGLLDIYDAHADGGFAPPPHPPAACEGEACQGPPTPPNDTSPSSALFSGPGNLLSAPVTTVASRRKTVAQARARQLSRALKACAKKPKAKRGKCKATARRRYGSKTKGTSKTTNKGGK